MNDADAVDCQSLALLIELLSMGGTGHRTVNIAAPTEAELRVANNRSGLAPRAAPKKLKIALAQDPGQWTFPPDTEPTILTIGAAWIESLREGISGISSGRGDYSIGTRKNDQRLWFWW